MDAETKADRGMKRWIVLAIVLASAAFAQQREDYPGQSGHAEPPKGWNCTSHPSAPADHKCDCKKTCTKPTDEEGNAIEGPLVVTEDPKCKAYCHADHCTCEVRCKQT